MYPYLERAVLPDGWEGADLSYGAARADPLADAPDWVQRDVFEGRQRNAIGLCFRADCGRPLADDTACLVHGSRASATRPPGAGRARPLGVLEARARRLAVLGVPRTRRHW